MNNVEVLFDYSISTKTKEDCIVAIFSWIKNGDKCKYLVCACPNSLEVARMDPYFHESIKNADLIIPDGMGIVLASKILGGQIKERITGSDIFLELSDSLNKTGNCSYFFLGSTENNLTKIADKMKKDFPSIKIAGTYSPPFKSEFSMDDNTLMIEAINRVKPDVLWVGMTAPKQEKWIYQNKDKLNVRFIGAIGAVFDFYTGAVRRSHPFFQQLGLEWLPRFLKEPRRLSQRNLVSSPTFFLRVLSKRLRKGF